MTVPSEAIEAAAEAMRELGRKNSLLGVPVTDTARAALTAAAPLIAAASHRANGQIYRPSDVEIVLIRETDDDLPGMWETADLSEGHADVTDATPGVLPPEIGRRSLAGREHPPQAVTAATHAVRRSTLAVPCPEDREIAIAVLTAAAPLIAAAERERIRDQMLGCTSCGGIHARRSGSLGGFERHPDGHPYRPLWRTIQSEQRLADLLGGDPS